MDIGTIGTLLYWCEGSKRERDRRVEFVNSDSKMISVFMKFIRSKGIDESRLRVRMLIHLQDDEEVCKEHWKLVTGLDEHHFLPTIVRRTSLVRHPLPFGTVTIRYNSVGLLRQINKEIAALTERL